MFGGDSPSNAHALEKKVAGVKLIGLSVPEIRRLLVRTVLRVVREFGAAIRWSNWRRRHQFRARECHYRSRRQTPPDE